MANIPLNKFRSLYYNISTTLSAIYIAPIERASIVVNSQVTNTTLSDINVTLMVSAEGSLFPVVCAIPVPPNDAISLVSGRLVLQGIDGIKVRPDVLLIRADRAGAVLSLGLLETVNRE